MIIRQGLQLCHCPILFNQLFDVELLSNLIDNMDNGKAAGLDELSSEQNNSYRNYQVDEQEI